MPWSRSPRECSRMPNSAQLRRRVSTWGRHAGSGMGSWMAAVGTGGPTGHTGLLAGAGLARSYAHRLAVALEHRRLVTHDAQGRFALGSLLRELALAAPGDPLLQAAPLVLARLRDIPGESAQLYRR